jgi:hypothetical protein
MSTETISNGKPKRKQLSEQLDRFDALLDGLSEGLTGMIADSAREGVRLAVKDAVLEIMTSPELRARLHDATAPEARPAPVVSQKPGFWARVKAFFFGAAESIGNGAVAAANAVAHAANDAAETIKAPLQVAGTLCSRKRLLTVSVLGAVAVATISYVAPHAIAAAVSGVGAGIVAASYQVASWLRRSFRALSLT